MKPTLVAAAALAVSAAFIPAPAKAGETVIGVTACQYTKSGMPSERAIELAIKGNRTFFEQILATGATGKEAG